LGNFCQLLGESAPAEGKRSQTEIEDFPAKPKTLFLSPMPRKGALALSNGSLLRNRGQENQGRKTFIFSVLTKA